MLIFTGVSEIHSTLRESVRCHGHSAGTWTRICGVWSFFFLRNSIKTNRLYTPRLCLLSAPSWPSRWLSRVATLLRLFGGHVVIYLDNWWALLMRHCLEISSILVCVLRSYKNLLCIQITECCVLFVHFSQRMTTKRYGELDKGILNLHSFASSTNTAISSSGLVRAFSGISHDYIGKCKHVQ